MSDYIPRNANEFFWFVKGIIEYTEKKIKSTWKHIPEAVFDELKAKSEDFLKRIEMMPRDPSKHVIRGRNDAQKECEKAVRHFIKFYIRNPIVTNEELVEMKIPPLDKERTPKIVVHETVEFEIKIKGTNNIIVDFWQSGVKSKAKPTGYDGAVIIWCISDDEGGRYRYQV